MTEKHVPNAGFVQALERELRSAARRERSLNGPVGSTKRSRARLICGSLILAFASMFVGGAATLAVTRGVDSETAKLFIARAETQIELARMRLELVEEETAEVQTL